ncbi:MAG TPA: hypothetical protein VMV53_03125 [Acidimicrobiales bacterium]|nr:hypothetical protein [Acidimicrobiales bacterium]
MTTYTLARTRYDTFACTRTAGIFGYCNISNLARGTKGDTEVSAGLHSLRSGLVEATDFLVTVFGEISSHWAIERIDSPSHE